ncbi:MAG: TlpA disulfide reductase family protein [Planctomycetota bacterium]
MPRQSLLAICFTLGPIAISSGAAPQDGPSATSDSSAERAAARLDELEAESSKIQLELFERYRAAKTDAERAKIPDYNLGAWAEVKPRVVEASAEFAGTPGAVPFLLWTVGASVRTPHHDEAIAAMETLLEDHASDERTVRVARSLPRYTRSLGVEQAVELAAAFEGTCPGDEAKAAFRFAGVRSKRLTGKELADALTTVVEEFPRTRAAREAAGWKFQVERLQVGMTVPELEGTTLDGTDFRLSDHRGKVVVLEFWAVNCGPCREKMPASAERVRRLADAPFLHVGVQSCDGAPEVVRELTEERGVNWPIVTDRSVDGSSFGPIGTKWNLSGWPTVFLIDHEGVIRSDWATEEVLAKMLPELIERAKNR